MFERFTGAAKDLVRGAAARAEQGGDAHVTAEHLLRQLLAGSGTPGAVALAAAGVDSEARRAGVLRGLDEARRRGGLTRSDAEALAGIGIDVDAVVDRVESTHGPGALARRRAGRRRRARFAADAKAVLERSLRIALGRGDKYVGDEHILLALAAGPGIPAEVLADHGATYAAIEAALPAVQRAG
ncbi:Clp protease N-terminal domain-containing protein [Streptomyces sp. WMMC500]|uniref:Clp protease N-terminal domain-containing protein n=1 Tax=Streptomyces sp. WMMC500 TaxID=3015154 RepID=UPI00248C534F|nr:Clp protease N-terminal domain-containing protein [Streptomyces sp. WMMC500]WBB63180.1 Clp protease N-terminal domain-containing protein [Streptomyces sp. WMMC500]